MLYRLYIHSIAYATATPSSFHRLPTAQKSRFPNCRPASSSSSSSSKSSSKKSKSMSRPICTQYSGPVMGQRDGFSQGDVSKLNSMYRCNEPQPSYSGYEYAYQGAPYNYGGYSNGYGAYQTGYGGFDLSAYYGGGYQKKR